MNILKVNWKTYRKRMIFAGLLAIVINGMAFGDDSGLALTLAVEGEQSGYQLPLGSKIGLTMVLENSTIFAITTEEGFLQTDLFKYLFLTDPNGNTHVLIRQSEKIDSMLPPLFWGKRAVLFAEILGTGPLKTVEIESLDELFPVTTELPGWYTIQAQQPFMRFAQKVEDVESGLVIGFVDDSNNWSGTVNSNKVQFYLAPAMGALPDVYIENQSTDPAQPLFQVPVRIFETDGVPADYEPEQYWTNVAPLLEGKTGTDGHTVWTTDSPCLIQGGYKVVAKFASEYQDADIADDAAEEDWDESCSGEIGKVLAFGDAQPVITGDLDGDEDVDRDDITIIRSYLRQPAGICPECDIDGDGVISVGDMRQLVLLCTRPTCATK